MVPPISHLTWIWCMICYWLHVRTEAKAKRYGLWTRKGFSRFDGDLIDPLGFRVPSIYEPETFHGPPYSDLHT